VLNGKLHAIGGKDQSGAFVTTEVYNNETNRWHLLVGQMNDRRGRAGYGVISHSIADEISL
jgi:hypothetical protein